MMKNNAELALLELDTIQSYKHNPTIYVELVGNACTRPTYSTMRLSKSASSRSPSAWNESPRYSSKPRPT